jgi:DNA oxidative demethylase
VSDRPPPALQLSLPIDAPPEGLTYVPDFVTPDEERALVERLNGVQLHQVVMHSQAAKRTVAHFGMDYGYDSRKALDTAPPIPDWLAPWCARVAPLMHEKPDAIAEILVTKYPPGARIGWHRDATAFGPAVAGLSLGGACELRLRREHAKSDTGSHDDYALVIAPRSLYVLAGAARRVWKHMIPPVPEARWSLTFRTLVAPDRVPSRAVSRRRGDG